MVKPIFPSRRNEDESYARSSASEYNVPHSGELDVEDGEEEERLMQNDNVFIDGAAALSRRPGFISQGFQSYDGSLHHMPQIPAHRERISSLPDREEIEPRQPRERRRSVPVGMDVGWGDSLPEPSTSNVSGDFPPAHQEIAAQGQELLWYILSREKEAQEVAELTIPPSFERIECLNEATRFGGRTLSEIAEAFSHSAQRARVRDLAESVDLQSLNYISFSNLLFGLFQEGGVSHARVLVLFFFCSDVALRALRENSLRKFQQLVNWMGLFITKWLSVWVLEHGGWAAVLQESAIQVYQVAVISACAISILALSVFLWKHR